MEKDLSFTYRTRLNGCMALTSHYHSEKAMQEDRTLFKLFRVRTGQLVLEVDHVKMILEANETVALTPLHTVNVLEVGGEYITLLFNSNFYCIYSHDSEVSCSGFLFHGSSDILKLSLTTEGLHSLDRLTDMMLEEFNHADNLQDESLRSLLKLIIIKCTRIAREKYRKAGDSEKTFDLVRRFHVLVDQHFKTKKQVQEYADLLNRSPKTLSHAFQMYGLGTPLRVIHERIEAEARRLLLHTSLSAKEIGDLLGFEDQASFSRFFKKMTGKSIFEFRKQKDD